MNNKILWHYYFCKLPFYSLTKKYQMPDNIADEIEPAYKMGASYLRQCLGEKFTSVSDAEIARRASWVRLWRDSDAFPSCLTNPEHEEIDIFSHTKNRPLILLTAHTGSFYCAFSSIAYTFNTSVCPVARSVDTSLSTPLPQQLFLKFNYWTTSCKLKDGHYIYTNFSGKLDRHISYAIKNKSILVNLIDMPEILHSAKRLPVTFIGKTAALPIGFIRWGLKKNAVFSTYWPSISADFSNIDSPTSVKHKLQIDPVIESDDEKIILQTYAARLSERISNEPWQWMGLPIANQYHFINNSTR